MDLTVKLVLGTVVAVSTSNFTSSASRVSEWGSHEGLIVERSRFPELDRSDINSQPDPEWQSEGCVRGHLTLCFEDLLELKSETLRFWTFHCSQDQSLPRNLESTPANT